MSIQVVVSVARMVSSGRVGGGWKQCFGSGSVWIRIFLTSRIRIRIRPFKIKVYLREKDVFFNIVDEEIKESLWTTLSFGSGNI